MYAVFYGRGNFMMITCTSYPVGLYITLCVFRMERHPVLEWKEIKCEIRGVFCVLVPLTRFMIEQALQHCYIIYLTPGSCLVASTAAALRRYLSSTGLRSVNCEWDLVCTLTCFFYIMHLKQFSVSFLSQAAQTFSCISRMKRENVYQSCKFYEVISLKCCMMHHFYH